MALEFVDSTWLYSSLLYQVHELRMVKANPKQNMDKRPCTCYPECSLPGLSTLFLLTLPTQVASMILTMMLGGNQLMIYAPWCCLSSGHISTSLMIIKTTYFAITVTSLECLFQCWGQRREQLRSTMFSSTRYITLFLIEYFSINTNKFIIINIICSITVTLL